MIIPIMLPQRNASGLSGSRQRLAAGGGQRATVGAAITD
jgi:hypothetical protein